MHPLFETSELLELIVAFIGFSPSPFYLRECSRYLSQEVRGEIHLTEADFFVAIKRRLNVKFLKLGEVYSISNSLISGMHSTLEDQDFDHLLESILQGGSTHDLTSLKEINLERILSSSLIRMNVPICDLALKCIELRGIAGKVVLKVLDDGRVQNALMGADALEWVERMIDNLPASDKTKLGNQLLVCATKFRAQRCINYLQGFTRDSDLIDKLLGAYAYAGDLERVKTFFATDMNVSAETIGNALQEAIRTQQFAVVAFLCAEWDKCHPKPSYSDRKDLATDLFIEICYLDGLFDDDLLVELLPWMFDGIHDMCDIRKWKNTLLDYACNYRKRALCNFLVERGCTSVTVQYVGIKLEKTDSLEFVDLCCGLKKNYTFNKSPAVELFLLKKGIWVRRRKTDFNPILEVLDDGLETGSFSGRIELTKGYLIADPTLATKLGDFRLRTRRTDINSCRLAPLAVVDLLGTPVIEVWSVRHMIEYAEFLSYHDIGEPEIDDWTRTRPNEIEIQALKDIKAVLLEYGATPECMFATDALSGVIWEGRIVSVELVKRIISGGADVNHLDKDGHGPLTRAFQTIQPIEVVKVLLESGATVEPDIWFDTVEHGLSRDELVAHNILWTALRTLTVIRNPDILRLLIDRKANINLRERLVHGLTPLAWVLGLEIARKHGAAAILLNSGADVNARDDLGRTAIFRAIGLDDKGAVDLLIKHGADLSLPDHAGRRCIDFARYCVLERLLDSVEILAKIAGIIGNTDTRAIDYSEAVRDLYPESLCWWSSDYRAYGKEPYRRPWRHG